MRAHKQRRGKMWEMTCVAGAAKFHYTAYNVRIGPFSALILRACSVSSPQALNINVCDVSSTWAQRLFLKRPIQTPTFCFVNAHLAAAQALHANVHTSGSRILSGLSRWSVIELLCKPVMMQLMVLMSRTSSSRLISVELFCSWCFWCPWADSSAAWWWGTVHRRLTCVFFCLCELFFILFKWRLRRLLHVPVTVLMWLTFKVILCKFSSRVSKLFSC